MGLNVHGNPITKAHRNSVEVDKIYRNSVELFSKPVPYAGPTPDSLPLGVQGLRLVSNGTTYTDVWGKTTSITPVTGRAEGSISSDIVLAAALPGRPFSVHVRYDRNEVASGDETFFQSGGGTVLMRTGSTTGLVVFTGFTRTFAGVLPAINTGQHAAYVNSTSTASNAKVDNVAATAQSNASTNTIGTSLTIGVRVDRTLSFKGQVVEFIVLINPTLAQDQEVHDYLIAAATAATPISPPPPPPTSGGGAPTYLSWYDNDQLPRSTFTQQVQNVDQAYCTQIATNRASLERFEVRVGDQWHGLSTERSELSGPSLAYDTDIWISFALKVLPGTDYASWNVIGQIHGTSGTSPLLAHELENGVFNIKTRHDRSGYTATTRHSFTYVRGQRYRFVHHIRLSKTGDGRLETWKDGVKIIDVTAPIGYNLPGSPYWKHGLYRSGSATQTIAIEWDNVEVQMGGSLLSRVATPLADPRL